MYEVQNAVYTPENVFAGDFPIVTDSVKVGTKKITRLSPVKLVAGKLESVAKGADDTATVADLYGIAADDADANGEAVIYLTGEFFSSGLALPADVTAEALKPAFRKLGIFLK